MGVDIDSDENEGDELQTLLPQDSRAELSLPRPLPSESEPAAPQKAFWSMSPSQAQALLAYEQAALRRADEIERASSLVRERRSASAGGRDEHGRLVLDPCIGRWELLRAKASLVSVLIAGVFVAVLVAGIGHRWIRSHVESGGIDFSEAVFVAGFALPAMLGGFLCILEHSEWAYLQTVSRQAQLEYTPLLHKVFPRLRRRGGRATGDGEPVPTESVWLKSEADGAE